MTTATLPQQIPSQVPDDEEDTPAGPGTWQAAGYPKGQLEPGNIDLTKRPIVHNPDGSYSTVRSMSFNDGGKHVLVPTIRQGLNRPMTPAEAIAHYRDTGEHLGMYDTPENATAYAKGLHNDQHKLYGDQQKSPIGVVPPDVPNAAQQFGNKWVQDLRSGIAGIPATPQLPTTLGAAAPGSERAAFESMNAPSRTQFAGPPSMMRAAGYGAGDTPLSEPLQPGERIGAGPVGNSQHPWQPQMIIPPLPPPQQQIPYQYGMSQKEAQQRADARENYRATPTGEFGIGVTPQGFMVQPSNLNPSTYAMATAGGAKGITSPELFAQHMNRVPGSTTPAQLAAGILPLNERQAMVTANANLGNLARMARLGNLPPGAMEALMPQIGASAATPLQARNVVGQRPLLPEQFASLAGSAGITGLQQQRAHEATARAQVEGERMRAEAMVEASGARGGPLAEQRNRQLFDQTMAGWQQGYDRAEDKPLYVLNHPKPVYQPLFSPTSKPGASGVAPPAAAPPTVPTEPGSTPAPAGSPAVSLHPGYHQAADGSGTWEKDAPPPFDYSQLNPLKHPFKAGITEALGGIAGLAALRKFGPRLAGGADYALGGIPSAIGRAGASLFKGGAAATQAGGGVYSNAGAIPPEIGTPRTTRYAPGPTAAEVDAAAAIREAAPSSYSNVNAPQPEVGNPTAPRYPSSYTAAQADADAAIRTAANAPKPPPPNLVSESKLILPEYSGVRTSATTGSKLSPELEKLLAAREAASAGIPATKAAAKGMASKVESGVPTMITQGMKKGLSEAGYTAEAIAKMTPEAAWSILGKTGKSVLPKVLGGLAGAAAFGLSFPAQAAMAATEATPLGSNDVIEPQRRPPTEAEWNEMSQDAEREGTRRIEGESAQKHVARHRYTKELKANEAELGRERNQSYLGSLGNWIVGHHAYD